MKTRLARELYEPISNHRLLVTSVRRMDARLDLELKVLRVKKPNRQSRTSSKESSRRPPNTPTNTHTTGTLSTPGGASSRQRASRSGDGLYGATVSGIAV